MKGPLKAIARKRAPTSVPQNLGKFVGARLRAMLCTIDKGRIGFRPGAAR